MCTSAIVDKHLGFKTHKMHVPPLQFKTRREKQVYENQIKMYEKSINDNRYMYTKNDGFKFKENDVKIVATENIGNGKLIETLCGQTAAIKPENIKEGVNDFSNMQSSKNKKDLLFLGPAAYVNHSCNSNTNWQLSRESIWCAKTIIVIMAGEEIS